MPKYSCWDHLVHRVARGWMVARQIDGLYCSEYRATGRGKDRQIRGRTLAELQHAGAKVYKSRVTAYQTARSIYPSGHPALERS